MAGEEPRGIEAAVDRLWGWWIARVIDAPRLVLAAVTLVTIALGAYTVRTLGVDADPRNLIARDLPFQVRQRELVSSFRTLGDGILVVLDADSPFTAQRAADALAERLAGRPDLFSQVHVPGGGPFFAKNALLYLEPDQLDDLVDRLSRVQPFLGEFARDQSLVGIADLLRDALAAERTGRGTGLDLSTAIDRVSTAIEATAAGRPAPDPWGSALLGGALPEEARRRIVALRPVLDYDTLLNAAPAVEAIHRAARDLDLVPARGVTVRITGDPVLNYEELVAIGRQTRLTAAVSFGLFTLAIAFALRSLRVVLALVGSLAASLVWTNAFAAATVGSLNQISACCNVFIVGLGGEFGIHACLRYVELRAQGRERRDALVTTGATTGSALFSSAVTTAIGFFIFLLTDFVGVAQLGLIAGGGMFLSLFATMTVLPAILALGPVPPAAPAPPPPAWLVRLEHLPVTRAGAIRIATLVLAAAGIACVPFVRFDHNLLALRDPTTESVATFEDLLSRAGTTPWTIDVVAPSLDAANALARRLETLPTVAHARTLTAWVPGDQDEKLETIATGAFFVPPTFADGPPRSVEEQRTALDRLDTEASRVGGDGPLVGAAARLRRALATFHATASADVEARLARLRAAIVGSLPEQVRDLEPLLAPERVTLAALPPELREQWVAADGRARVEVVARADLSESAALEAFVDSVRTVAPDATGAAVWLVEWGRVSWHAMRAAFLGGMACMIVFLVCLWRSLWDTLLAFFPLALATLLTCASLVVAGQPFNFANVIVLPMLVGMGVDNGVHLVHRHRTEAEEDVLGTSTARAVFFAALTTVLCFGSLAFTSHRGMAEIGQLLTIGVAITLACYVVVLPAVLEWDDRRRRPR